MSALTPSTGVFRSLWPWWAGAAYLGINDMPGVRHQILIFAREGSVAGAGGSKGDHADLRQRQLLCNVKGRQRGKCTPQRMPCTADILVMIGW